MMKLVVWVLGGAAGLLLVAVLILSAMSMRPDASRAVASVDIAATPAQIWPWLQEGEKAKRWVGWLVEVKPVGPNKEIWVMEDKNNGGQRMEIEGTLLKSDFPRSMTVGLKAPGGFTGEQSYTLTELGNGSTRVQVDSRFRFEQAVSRLLAPVIASAARNKLAGDLKTLKTVVATSSR